MDTTELLALMAAILEAGDRAFSRESAAGDERTERSRDYVDRAGDLLIESNVWAASHNYAKHHRDLLKVARFPEHRLRTPDEQREHDAIRARYAEAQERANRGEATAEDEEFLAEYA